MMRFPSLTACAILLSLGSASAQTEIDPADLRFSCNDSGAVMTLTNGTTYYLGKSCDAARKGGGTGKWWYAAGAFLIGIGDQTLRIGGADIPCTDMPYCRY
ncbi:hypothetical protein M4578_05890 [Salipiger sp. P9]|uniref:hypothetical protein n=1 Tax=Salipiger pentaromativorans TaxID=2943193 RepID=UPI002157DC18|nr:hypothetical protein [Salipiger pentaromativorans]MCR8547349.1 hypothetical protein [Salipiger pentaromativorans]